MDQPRLEFVTELRVRVAAPTEIGQLAEGKRRVIDILGGEFNGPLLRGTIKPGGADWQLVRSDNVAELDARYTLVTESGAPVYVSNRGIRYAEAGVMAKLLKGEFVEATEYYFWSTPTFETAAPDLQWLRQSIFIASGTRFPNLVVIQVWRVC
jgi:Protein of unknown function (DUF3237)